MYLRLRSERQRKNKNQTDMAKLLRIDRITYGNKERGKKDFTLSEAVKLSSYFEITIEELFEEGFQI